MALRLCLERMLPWRRDAPVRMVMPDSGTVLEVNAAGEAVLQAIADSNLTPLEGETMSRILENRRRVIETGELSARIDKLEDAAAEQAKHRR